MKRGAKCECDSIGELNPSMASRFDAKTELPFVNHRPGKCKCVNNLKRYRRADGSVKWLCSCCNVIGDRLIN